MVWIPIIIILLALGAVPMDDLVGIHTPWPWRILVWVGWPIGMPIMGIIITVSKMVEALDAD